VSRPDRRQGVEAGEQDEEQRQLGLTAPTGDGQAVQAARRCPWSRPPRRCRRSTWPLTPTKVYCVPNRRRSDAGKRPSGVIYVLAPTLDNAEFRSEYIKPGTIVEDIVFQRCYFDNCSVRQAEDPEHRTIFRRLVFKDCRAWACNLDDVILEEVMVDGLRTGSGGGRIYPLKVTGARFTHVILRGNVGAMIITPRLGAGSITVLCGAVHSERDCHRRHGIGS